MLNVSNETTNIKNALAKIKRNLNDAEAAKIAQELRDIENAISVLQTIAHQSQ